MSTEAQTRANTMGEAVDEALRRHEESYPGSKVYAVSVTEDGDTYYYVEVRAEHFNRPFCYYTDKAVVE